MGKGVGGYWVTPEHPHLTEVSHILARPHLAHRSLSWSLPTELEVSLIGIVIEMKDWHWLCVFCGWVLNADGHYLIVTERFGLRFGDVWIFIGRFYLLVLFIRISSSNITALWCRWLQNIFVICYVSWQNYNAFVPLLFLSFLPHEARSVQTQKTLTAPSRGRASAARVCRRNAPNSTRMLLSWRSSRRASPRAWI